MAMPVAHATSSPAPPIASTVPALQVSRPADVRREVQKEIKNLESKDDNVLLKATASLVMLATLPDAASHLSLAIPHLVSLLHGAQQPNVKKNACAALTTIMNASPMLYLSVAQSPGLCEALVTILNGDEKFVDDTVQLNAAAALSILAQREEGLQKIQEVSGDDALILVLSSPRDERLMEEAMDAICTLASHENMRDTLVQKGIITLLADLIKSSTAEICVRALLALGILCGSSPSAQLKLAEADRSIQTLLRLTRSEDSDIRGISRDLFKALAVNEKTRPLVDQTLRSR